METLKQKRQKIAQQYGFKTWGAYLAHKIALNKAAPKPAAAMRKPWEIVGWTAAEYQEWLNNIIQGGNNV